MAHARWSDIIRFTLALFAGLGVYYLFYYFRAEVLGSVFAFITIISICFLEYYIPSLIKNKIDDKRVEKYKAKKQQEYDENIDNLLIDSMICPRCQSIVKKGNKYCYGCGTQFQN